jgi:nickel/cobalt transporter (NicO) family protein
MSLIVPLIGIIGFGLSHGINPSHGWPVAVLYAMRTRRPLLSGIVSSSIIAGAHFVSSIAVVVIYIIVVNSLKIQIPEVYMKYGAAGGRRKEKILLYLSMDIFMMVTIIRD